MDDTTAGVLTGLSKAGRRPDFAIVTGVSTGALIAPFAFLGPEWDDKLRDAYTGGYAAKLLSLGGLFVFMFKVTFFFFLFAMVKAIVPRYRYDQLMRLGWKVFLPMSLLFVAATSSWLMATGAFGEQFAIF